MKNSFVLITTLILAIFWMHGPVYAVTKVGNGDDGSDLEGAEVVTHGPLVDSRKKATDLLEKLNISGIRGMGTLIPEVEQAPIYLAKKDVAAKESSDQTVFHSDTRGLVFARTFAEPHAATRFFPIALKTDQSQLVALHIHEALHRALPSQVRENEQAVTSLTLAMTSPGASFDRVETVAAQWVPEKAKDSDGGVGKLVADDRNPIPMDAQINNPSSFSYTFKSFSASPDTSSNREPRAQHSISSFLYPFGSDKSMVGLGLEASLFNLQDGKTQSGPLSVSARMRLWSERGFDFGAWGVASLNMLSSDELKNSPYGRDVYTFGLSMRKDLPHLYIENLLSLSTAGESQQKISNVSYTYSYGSVVNATVRLGSALGKLHFGAYGEVFLADYFRVSGGAYSSDTGRYRIISGGPEIYWEEKNWRVGVFGKFLLDSTQDSNFSYLGNVMGQGIGQGSVGVQASFML